MLFRATLFSFSSGSELDRPCFKSSIRSFPIGTTDFLVDGHILYCRRSAGLGEHGFFSDLEGTRMLLAWDRERFRLLIGR